MRLQLDHWNSPLSPLLIVTDDDGVLRALEFADLEPRMMRLLGEHYGTHSLHNGTAPAPLTRALTAYFSGELAAVDDIQTGTAGTPFQREVWSALRKIPAGTTTTYGQLASAIGRTGSARAVGAANGSNPIPIVVPCHRVVGANGTLTGFAGGLPRKRWLLDHESRFAQTSLFAARAKCVA
jgi:methylated-DNA-[protein]-cysteine S-methyltransferase